MEINEFVQYFAAQFEETDASVFTANTVIKELEEWDSLIALSVIAMVDEEYSVKITGADIRNSETVADVFNIVNTKKG